MLAARRQCIGVRQLKQLRVSLVELRLARAPETARVKSRGETLRRLKCATNCTEDVVVFIFVDKRLTSVFQACVSCISHHRVCCGGHKSCIVTGCAQACLICTRRKKKNSNRIPKQHKSTLCFIQNPKINAVWFIAPPLLSLS